MVWPRELQPDQPVGAHRLVDLDLDLCRERPLRGRRAELDVLRPHAEHHRSRPAPPARRTSSAASGTASRPIRNARPPLGLDRAVEEIHRRASR